MDCSTDEFQCLCDFWSSISRMSFFRPPKDWLSPAETWAEPQAGWNGGLIKGGTASDEGDNRKVIVGGSPARGG